MWKIRNGKNQESVVPAPIVLIPGPCAEAIDSAVRLHGFVFSAPCVTCEARVCHSAPSATLWYCEHSEGHVGTFACGWIVRCPGTLQCIIKSVIQQEWSLQFNGVPCSWWRLWEPWTFTASLCLYVTLLHSRWNDVKFTQNCSQCALVTADLKCWNINFKNCKNVTTW